MVKATKVDEITKEEDGEWKEEQVKGRTLRKVKMRKRLQKKDRENKEIRRRKGKKNQERTKVMAAKGGEIFQEENSDK